MDEDTPPGLQIASVLLQPINAIPLMLLFPTTVHFGPPLTECEVHEETLGHHLMGNIKFSLAHSVS